METTLGFTRSEVLAVFEKRGLTPPTARQLHYWADTKLIKVEMRNLRMPIYSFQTILDIMVICRLLDGGVPLQRIRKALDYLEKHCGWGTTTPSLEAFDLITDGQDILKVEGYDHVMSLLRKPGQLGWRVFVLPTREIVSQTAQVIVLNGWSSKLSAEERTTYLTA